MLVNFINGRNTSNIIKEKKNSWCKDKAQWSLTLLSERQEFQEQSWDKTEAENDTYDQVISS